MHTLQPGLLYKYRGVYILLKIHPQSTEQAGWMLIKCCSLCIVSTAVSDDWSDSSRLIQYCIADDTDIHSDDTARRSIRLLNAAGGLREYRQIRTYIMTTPHFRIITQCVRAQLMPTVLQTHGRPVEGRIWSIERRHFRDLERPLSPVSRSRHLWRWISQKRYDMQTWFHTTLVFHTKRSGNISTANP